MRVIKKEEKMKILAIETSLVVSSCAICEENFVLASFSVATGFYHSKTLMVLVDEMFKKSNISLDDIKAVAVSIGPGSFTGLRIGVSAAKGIAFGLNLPCIGVETLTAIAYNFMGFNALVCPCIDARNDRVYIALFEINGFDMTVILKDCIKSIKELKEILISKKQRVFLAGDAALKCFEEMKDCGDIFLAPAKLMMPDAVNIAVLGQKKLQTGKFSTDELIPKYLKLSQAEEQMKQKLKKETKKRK